MTEIIAARMKRIFSGTVADIVENIEKGRAESVMREAIREVERAAEETRAEEARATARRLQAARHAQMARDKIADLGDRARVALSHAREDLAKAAVSRQLDLEDQLQALLEAEKEAAAEEAARARDAAALSIRLEEMQDYLAAFVDARRQTAQTTGSSAPGAESTLDRRVADSVAAFERTMKAATGNLPTIISVDADTDDKLAELNTVLREKQIAAKLAALRSDGPSPAI